MPAREKHSNRLILGIFFTLSLVVIASIAPALAAAQPAPAVPASQNDAALGPDARLMLPTDCTLAPFPLECDALIALYTDTDGANWVNTLASDLPWNVDNSPCGWFGVTCDLANHVISIDLNTNNLFGTLPTTIDDLTFLEDLILNDNPDLTGNLPIEIGNITSLLTINLNGNTLMSGDLPAELTTLTLTEFDYFSTSLCEPQDAAFQAWILTVTTYTNSGIACAAPTATFTPVATNTPINTATFTSTPVASNTPTNTGTLTITFTPTASNTPTNTGTLTSTASNTPTNTLAPSATLTPTFTLAPSATLTPTFTLAPTFTPSETPTSTPTFTPSATPTLCEAQTQIPVAECEALVAFYNSTGGATWANKSGWLTTDPPCTWAWVFCNATFSNVLWLYPFSNNLSGPIPPEIGNLTKLDYLFLYDNKISGSIPPEIGNLVNLTYLDLSYNKLTGSIPAEIGTITTLENIILRQNSLSGSIPPELGNLSSLGYLNLYKNQLSGGIPSNLGNLSNLYYLSLSYNKLTGSVPANLGNLSNLEYFYISYNTGLTGQIPLNWTNLTSLYDFYFQDTSLCAPHTTTFINWFATISNYWGYWCGSPTSTPYSSGGGATATKTLFLPSNTPTMIGPFQTLTVMAFQETQQASTPRTATPTLDAVSILKTNIAATASAPATQESSATLSYAARTLTAASMQETFAAGGGTPVAVVSATATDSPTPPGGGAGSVEEGAATGGLFSRLGPCLILPILLLLIGVGIEVYNRYFKNRKDKTGEDAFSF